MKDTYGQVAGSVPAEPEPAPVAIQGETQGDEQPTDAAVLVIVLLPYTPERRPSRRKKASRRRLRIGPSNRRPT